MDFTLEISVTEKCNLGCPYCYVANKPTFMTNDVFDQGMDKLKDLMKRSGAQKYDISFFGGEPLLNWELIKYAAPVLKNDPLCKYFNIISNMTLIDEEKFEFIKENDIMISWSFDGLGSNESRPLLPIFENKNKETGKIFSGVIEIYESKKDLILNLVDGCKVMIWPGNAKDMTDNFKFFLDWGIDHPDFTIVRDDVWTINDIKIYKEELDKLADHYIDVVKSGKACSIGIFKIAILDTLFGLVKGKRPFGCFAGTNGAVLMPDGEFYPCARFASKKVMEINDDYDFKYFQNKFNPRNFDKCEECDIRQICNAGCSYSQVINGNKPVDSICELFHINQVASHRVLEELKDVPIFRGMVQNWVRNVG